MATLVYNRGLEKLLDGTVDFENDNIKVLLVNTNHTFDGNNEFVSNIAGNESSGTGYSRKVLSNTTLTLDESNDKIVYDADDVQYTTLDIGNVSSAIIFSDLNDDNTSPLLVQVDFANTTIPAGLDANIIFNSNGIFEVTNPQS